MEIYIPEIFLALVSTTESFIMSRFVTTLKQELCNT